MTYQAALEWIEGNKHLIGTVTEKGMYIGDLVAVPVSSTSDHEAFLKNYVLNRNADFSIMPFIGDDMEVWAIDTKRLTPNGVFLYKRLAG